MNGKRYRHAAPRSLPYLPGLPLRFHLQDVARVAQALDLQPIAAAVLAEIHSIVRRGDEGSKASQQHMRMDERMRLHRLLVQRLAARSPPQAIPLGAQARPSARARGAPQVQRCPVNYELIGMTQDEYCKVFREEVQRSGMQAWWAPREALVDDCRALNIAFAKRRPKGSKDRSPRRRAAR